LYVDNAQSDIQLSTAYSNSASRSVSPGEVETESVDNAFEVDATTSPSSIAIEMTVGGAGLLRFAMARGTIRGTAGAGVGGAGASMGESSSEEGAMGSGGGMAFFALDVTARGLNDM
jgi:hypothetical protein